VGAATSEKVEGPYTPVNNGTAALICPLEPGGAIDPEGFRDADGKRYLLYKIDGNSLNRPNQPWNPTPIMLQEVEDDGYTKVGEPKQILDREAEDGPLIEAPSLLLHGNGSDALYFLFYSSNNYATEAYDVSYATSKNLAGPYKRSESRLLRTGEPRAVLNGPGGMDTGVDGSHAVFHSTKQTKEQGGLIRQMWTAELKINGTTVTI
jgi:beta-xylosidase